MLFVDGGLDRVGIGTASPSKTLHMATSTSGTYMLLDDGTNCLFQIQSTTSAGIIQVQQTGFASWKPMELRANYFELKPNNTTALSLTGVTADFTHTQSAHTNGIKIINSQAGGYGSALTFQSERSDDNSIVSAAQIRTQGQDSWNSAASADSNLFFATALDGSLNDRMVIKLDGSVGVGTTSPTARLDVRGSVNSEHVVITGASNSGRGLSIQTAASNGQQDAGVVFDAQDTENGANPYIQLKVAGADVAKFSKGSTDKYPTSGGLGGIGGTGANFHLDGDDSEIRMANNLIHSDNSGNTKFTIRAAYGAVATQAELSLDGGHMTLNTGTSFTERIRILGTGEVCIGKTSADFDTRGVHINQTGAIYSGIVGNQAANTYHVRDTTNNTWEFYVTNAGVINATSTSISSLSDVRLKENIKDLETGLDEVIALKPRRFDWKDREEKNVAGFIAQEVEPVLPDLIGDFMHDDLDDAKTVKMSDMIPTLVKAIQEQQEQIETLKTEVQELKDNG